MSIAKHSRQWVFIIQCLQIHVHHNSKDFYLYASIIYGECNNKINWQFLCDL